MARESEVAEPIKPATDGNISTACDLSGWGTDEFQQSLIARIESDAAKLRERDEQIARYEDLIAAYSETDAKAQKAEEIGGGYETRAAAIEFLKAEKAVAAEGRAILARRKEASRG